MQDWLWSCVKDKIRDLNMGPMSSIPTDSACVAAVPSMSTAVAAAGGAVTPILLLVPLCHRNGINLPMATVAGPMELPFASVEVIGMVRLLNSVCYIFWLIHLFDLSKNQSWLATFC